jgi:hypothetical protein
MSDDDDFEPPSPDDIRELMRELGLNQGGFAARIRVSPTYLSHFMNHKATQGQSSQVTNGFVNLVRELYPQDEDEDGDKASGRDDQSSEDHSDDSDDGDNDDEPTSDDDDDDSDDAQQSDSESEAEDGSDFEFEDDEGDDGNTELGDQDLRCQSDPPHKLVYRRRWNACCDMCEDDIDDACAWNCSVCDFDLCHDCAQNEGTH